MLKSYERGVFEKRLDQLQILRFIAFLLIFFWHIDFYKFSWMPGINGALLSVSFFFVLSGFVTGYSGCDKNVEITFKSIAKYMWKKIVKLYPLYFFVMVVFIAKSSIPIEFSFKNNIALKESLKTLFKCLFMVQSWSVDEYYAFNGVGWFLSNMMFFYLLNIPLLWIFNKINKKQIGQVVFSGLIVVVFVSLIFYCYMTRNSDIVRFQYIYPIARLFEYLIGILFGFIICNINKKYYSLEKFKVYFTIIESIALFVWLCSVCMPVKYLWAERSLQWVVPNILVIIVFAIGKGYISELFKVKILRYFGDISFECYILHVLVINFISAFLRLSPLMFRARLFFVCFSLFVTVYLASLISTKQIK